MIRNIEILVDPQGEFFYEKNPIDHNLKKNWSAWEKKKYWEKHGGKGWHGDDKREHQEGKGKGKGKGKHKD
jgi:hypothetical protein